jgi:outer membrane protein assembly factor BamE (lipoprotein component of BamABCDE complex)
VNYKEIIALVGCLAALQGCAMKSISHGSEITQKETQKIVVGKTTKQEIFLNFGEPTKMADSERVFFYSWTRGSKFEVMGIGSGSAKGSSLVVIFDDAGVVKDYRISRGAGDAVQGD